MLRGRNGLLGRFHDSYFLLQSVGYGQREKMEIENGGYLNYITIKTHRISYARHDPSIASSLQRRDAMHDISTVGVVYPP